MGCGGRRGARGVIEVVFAGIDAVSRKLKTKRRKRVMAVLGLKLGSLVGCIVDVVVCDRFCSSIGLV